MSSRGAILVGTRPPEQGPDSSMARVLRLAAGIWTEGPVQLQDPRPPARVCELEFTAATLLSPLPLRARALEEYHRRRRASTSANASFAVCVQNATLRFRSRALRPRQAEAASLKGPKAELQDPAMT